MIDWNHFVEKNKGIKVNPLHNDKSCIEDKINPNTESDYKENYKPFISGVVSLVGDENSSQKVKILRDTGATQSLMLDSVLPLTENSFTGANLLNSGVGMGILEGTFFENIDGKFEERNKEKADNALMRNESRNVKENIPEKQENESKSVISRQNLIVEQSKDKELLDLFKIALTPVEAEKVSVGYLIRDNIMMRKWSTHHVTIRPLLLLREKWLDEDPEKISVLKYVATFKDRLFRAGQMAKRNLQESQSKMKVWYDRKAKSRCFEPGDRVLVLFPVVGNSLQAKYSGPYKVVKKISDTNYLVKTPGRRKETQVCHINMLKAYHEQTKPELVTLNNRLGLERMCRPSS